MKVALAMKGFKLGIYRTATLMKQAAVKAIRPSRKHYYPNAGKAHLVAPNLLDRQFNPEQANTHWVCDITYIRTHQGWSYLACVLDLATKEIVGWAMSKSPNAELAKVALSHAIRRQQPDTATGHGQTDVSFRPRGAIFCQIIYSLLEHIENHTEHESPWQLLG
jgi:transposase InsO family protein